MERIKEMDVPDPFFVVVEHRPIEVLLTKLQVPVFPMCNTFIRKYVANACRHAVPTTNYERRQLRSGNSCVLRSDDDGWNSKHNRVFPVICNNSTEFLLNDVLKQV
jgi:hypothetical protein